MTVFVLEYGEGCDGDDLRVEGVFASEELAEARRKVDHIADYRYNITPFKVVGWPSKETVG